VGSRSLGRLLLYEAVVTLFSWIPGRWAWCPGRPPSLAARRVGRNVTFGRASCCAIRARSGSATTWWWTTWWCWTPRAPGTAASPSAAAFLSWPRHHPVLQGRRHRPGRPHEHRLPLRGVLAPRHRGPARPVRRPHVPRGRGHEFERADVPVIEQDRSSRGITLGDNVWLGTGTKVLDGVRIGRDVVVGAGAVVTEDLPTARSRWACPRAWCGHGRRRPRREPRQAHPGRDVRRPVRPRRPPRHRGGDLGRAALRRLPLRRAGHAAEPLRPPALRLLGDAPHRRRRDRGQPARGPGHLAALSELRRPPLAPRLLAEPPHARVLRPLGALHAGLGPEGALQGRRAPPRVPYPRPLAAAPERDPSGRAVAHHPGPPAALRRLSSELLYPPPP
jgi:hypothetical protein